MGPGDLYTIFRLEGRDAAAGYTMRPDERAQGIPPHWMLYILVDSADDAAARAEKLGGKMLAPAFDVMTVGRMAVLQDPTGVVFTAWQTKGHSGIGIAGVPGTLCWADLSTPDPARAQEFYSALFGWKIGPGENDKSGVLAYPERRGFIGGVPPAGHRNPHEPPHWMIYFQVADVDATTAQAKAQGGKAYLEPMSMEGVGRFSVLADPQGAAFAVFKSARG